MMVSIVIPAYNAEKFIEETIKSVQNQTYKDWELIIIDDGSTDQTAAIIKDLEQTNERIKYHHQENAGVSAARNHGLHLVKGNYVALLDADDVWEPRNLEEKIDCLVANADVKWVYSNMFNADENMQVIGEANKGHDKDVLNAILLWQGEVVPGPCSNVVFDAECLKDGIAFDTRLSTAADQDFTIQLAARYRAKHIPKNLWKYRILSNSMSRNIKVMEKDHLYVYKKAEQHQLFKSFWFKQKCFSNLYWTLAGSWWKDGQNKLRGLGFVFLALLNNPLSLGRILK